MNTSLFLGKNMGVVYKELQRQYQSTVGTVLNDFAIQLKEEIVKIEEQYPEWCI